MASSLPDGGSARVLSAVLCATMIETGCLDGGGGGLLGREGPGGPRGLGTAHGGRWINWTCPVWRPAMARSVEWGAVAIASSPAHKPQHATLHYDRSAGYAPLGLSDVSHSPYRLTVSPISKTQTRRRSDTASQPRRHAIPRTRSLNSSSATSFPSASSQMITLFGG